MNRTIFLLLAGILLFFNSCVSNRVYMVNDTYKQTKTISVNHQKYAKSLRTKHLFKTTHLVKIEWKKLIQPRDYMGKINFFTSVLRGQELDTLFFIKTDNQLFKLKFDRIKSVSQRTYEKEIQKDADEKDSIVYYKYNEYEFLKAMVSISKDIFQSIRKTNTLSLRFYIEEKAYTVKYNQREIRKIKKMILLK